MLLKNISLIFGFVLGSLVSDFGYVISLIRGSSVGGLVSGLGVSGLGVSSWFVIVSLGISLVFNVSDVTGIAIDVISDNLLAAVGENDGVGTGGLVTIASLVLVHIDVVVVVLHGVIVFVVSGGLFE